MFKSRFKSLISSRTSELLDSKINDEFIEAVTRVSRDNSSAFLKVSDTRYVKVGTIDTYNDRDNSLLKDLFNDNELASIKPLEVE